MFLTQGFANSCTGTPERVADMDQRNFRRDTGVLCTVNLKCLYRAVTVIELMNGRK